MVNDEGQFYALRNNCTHQDYPSLGGAVSLGHIKCEKHVSQFELTTGEAKVLPAVKAGAVYQTSVDAGVMYVLALQGGLPGWFRGPDARQPARLVCPPRTGRYEVETQARSQP